MKKIEVVIWDSSPERIIEIDRNLNLAATYENVSLNISIMSEIPLLGRNSMLKRIPVLEIGGKYWSLHPRKAFNVEECRSLLQRYASLID